MKDFFFQNFQHVQLFSIVENFNNLLIYGSRFSIDFQNASQNVKQFQNWIQHTFPSYLENDYDRRDMIVLQDLQQQLSYKRW
jgi:hypothetical protein